MPSNLDLAVRDLVLTKNTPTVAAVMVVYIRMSGLDNESVQQSMSSFERALEKHPHRDDEVSSAIVKVRNDYWYNKLGGTNAEGVCHVCECCGALSLPCQTQRHAHSKDAKKKKAKPRL